MLGPIHTSQHTKAGDGQEKTKSKTTVSDLKDPNGHIIHCDLEKADLLNTFFASVFVSEPPGKLPVFDVRYQCTPN